MGDATSRWDRADQWAFAALRIMAGLIYLAHGIQKAIGFPVPFTMGVVTPLSLLGVSACLEVVLGAAMAIGICTRPAAFIASGHMAVAYFLVHARHGLYPVANGGDAAVLLCFIFLFVAAHGGGRWALDARRVTSPSAGV